MGGSNSSSDYMRLSAPGHVRVFGYDGQNNAWSQLGQDLDGKAIDEEFGTSVALSADGTILVAGALYNDGNGSNSGRARV